MFEMSIIKMKKGLVVDRSAPKFPHFEEIIFNESLLETIVIQVLEGSV